MTAMNESRKPLQYGHGMHVCTGQLYRKMLSAVLEWPVVSVQLVVKYREKSLPSLSDRDLCRYQDPAIFNFHHPGRSLKNIRT